MALIDLTFENGSEALRVRGDIPEGWQQWENGFGFFGRGTIPFRKDQRLDVNLRVLARPNRLASRAPTFPPGLWAGAGNETLNYEMKDSKLQVYVALVPNLKVLEQSGKLGIVWHPNEPIPGIRRVNFWVELLVVVNSHSDPPPQDIIEPDLLPFLSGQFESNRSRH